jgi:exodeoxyribonuclease-3
MALRIATWNIAGIKARLEVLLRWLDEEKPDIVGLQEIKSVDEAFPRAEIEALGYNVETHGQKSWNGVALLSKLPFDEVHRGLPGDETDEQARLIEGVFSVEGGAIRVCNIYLPNGNPVDTEKFPYKLRWMDRLNSFAAQRLALEEPYILMGDFNLIPEPIDCHAPDQWSRKP